MRGRTNISGGGGLAINGDVNQFKVVEGSSIVSGDFVSILSKTSNKYKGSGAINRIFKISENRIVGFRANEFWVLEVSNNGIEEYKTFSINYVYSFEYIYQIDNSHFVTLYSDIEINTSNQMEVRINYITIDIENNLVNVEGKIYEIVVPEITIFEYYEGLVSGNFLFFPIRGYLGENSKNSKQAALVWININNQEWGYKLVEKKYNTLGNKCTLLEAEKFDFYLFSSGLNDNGIISVCKFNFNEENAILELVNYYQPGVGDIGHYKYGDVCYLGNNRFSYTNLDGTYKHMLYVFEFTNDLYLKINEIILEEVTGDREYQIFKLENKIIILGFGSTYYLEKCYVININDILNIKEIQFNSLDSSIKIDYYNLVLFGMGNNVIISSEGAIIEQCKIMGNTLVGVDDIQTVSNYNGSALGVAKTSGNAGDIIDVYVPSSTT